MLDGLEITSPVELLFVVGGLLVGVSVTVGLLTSFNKPFILADGPQEEIALGGLFPGTFTVVLKRSISFPCVLCK